MSKNIRLKYWGTIVSLFTLTVLGVSPVSVAQAVTAKTSSGKLCTITGTAGADVLVGTSKNDVICGLGGNDVISGEGGKDTIDGGVGDDTIDGGLGNDKVYGGVGSDKINGDEGDDRLLGESGKDTIFGDEGNDGLIGGTGKDNLSGTSGEPAPEERNLCERDENDQITYCGFDNFAPWVSSIAMSRTKVDATSSNQTVELTMRVTDELMGVLQGHSICGLIHEKSFRTEEIHGWFKRISGDAIDGVYKCTVTISKQNSPGRWGLTLSTVDAVGNRADFEQWTNEKRFFGDPILDLPEDFWVTNTGRGDGESPRITNPEVSRNTMNTGSSDQAVTVSMTITDDFFGVGRTECVALHNQTDWVDGIHGVSEARLVSGTRLRGNYSCTILMPKHSAKGKWIFQLTAWDKSGQQYTLVSNPYVANEWVDSFGKIIPSKKSNYFIQTAPGDDTAPVLRSITISPSKINSSSKDQTIKAKITFAPDTWSSRPLYFSLDNRAGSQVNMFCTKSKSNGSDVFTCSGTLLKGSAGGTYFASMVVIDALGNRGDYRPNRCTGEYQDIGTLKSFGRVGPSGFYNGVGEVGSEEGQFCTDPENPFS